MLVRSTVQPYYVILYLSPTAVQQNAKTFSLFFSIIISLDI